MPKQTSRDDAERLLQRLSRTPVGRRWVLGAGLSLASLKLTSRHGQPRATTQKRDASPSPAATSPAAATTALQFALGALTSPTAADAVPVSDLVLSANGSRYPLTEHTDASRAALNAQGGLWAKMDLSALTHYVPDVTLPGGRAMLLSVFGMRGTDEVGAAQTWYVPEPATLALAQTAVELGGTLTSMLGGAQRMTNLGITASTITDPAEVAQLDTVVDQFQTAWGFTMCHPQVTTVDPTNAAITKSVISGTTGVSQLGIQIASLHQQGQNWLNTVQAVNPDGSPTEIAVGSTITTFKAFSVNRNAPGVVTAAQAALTAGIRAVRDNPDLGTVIDKPLEEDPAAAKSTWIQPQGIAPQVQTYSSALTGSGLSVTIKNEGFLTGTSTVVDGTVSGATVPLRIYNNWVRWAWVYAQYLGPNDANLSLNPGATWPDTPYAKSVGLLPQVSTVYGVPIWNTNSITVDLDFSQAHTARLLFCGLGAYWDQSWRQYFPADAYPGLLAAPTKEVIFASFITGIFTVGLNVFALANDFDIGTAWIELKDKIVTGLNAMLEAIEDIAGGKSVLTSAEYAAVDLLCGFWPSTFSTPGGIWARLLSLGTALPKILFPKNPSIFWEGLALTILGDEAGSKLISALPVIGEVLDTLDLLGDIASLAEVTAESLSSPWVIENEVSVNYTATVTISIDTSQASTFPVTARSWRLEALVDGATVLSPISGLINEGGRTRSAPLVLTVTAPFGGPTIQWSVVMLDANGNQVGTGVSGQYANNDAGHLPTAVPITLTQIPAVITAKTVFQRADTVVYSAAAGGYTWSDQVTDAGVLDGPGAVQEVTGAAVATLAGVAAMVWKQSDRYYLRGVPLAQNGSTIELGTALVEGYNRRPFVLLDPFVGRGDRNNHVLLEPDDGSDGYLVRKITFDPVTSSISWDKTVSYGTFALPVDAAALHSSGRVVTVHTNASRIGMLQPTPPVAGAIQTLGASFFAGPGTQIGLLQAPAAVAITNPGTVLVLEAGASQLSAFDLNGNPVAYFGTDPANLQFTLPLSSAGTYMDLAVDGASQMYLLYYTGDGSAPADYRVDVYTSQGAPLATNSPGVNVAHMAVDYWRSIFGVNFDALVVAGTTSPHVDPALGVIEPSVSRFDPSTPADSAAVETQ